MSRTTVPGYENLKRQKVVKLAAASSNHWNQKVYQLECLKCGHQYGANGCDIHIRRCPACQGGQPGLKLPS